VSVSIVSRVQSLSFLFCRLTVKRRFRKRKVAWTPSDPLAFRRASALALSAPVSEETSACPAKAVPRSSDRVWGPIRAPQGGISPDQAETWQGPSSMLGGRPCKFSRQGRSPFLQRGRFDLSLRPFRPSRGQSLRAGADLFRFP
jgi:hypothetical protein